MTAKSAYRSRRSSGEVDALIERIIVAAKEPIGAYDILRKADEQNCSMSATQVYRSLGRLMDTGSVERIASWNAFVASGGDSRVHLLCENCRKHLWAAPNTVHGQLQRLCEEAGFQPQFNHVELNGLCADCESGQPTAL